jgi:polygalacturonase
VLYSALRLKNNRMRGGTIEQVYMRDVTVGLVDRAVVDIDLFYEEGRSGDFMPHIRDIRVQRMTVDRCRTALNLVGYDDGPLRDILLEDCTFRNVSAGYAIRNVEGLRLVRTTVNGVEVTP